MGFGGAGTGINLVGLVLTSGMSAKHLPSITQPESLPMMKPMITIRN